MPDGLKRPACRHYDGPAWSGGGDAKSCRCAHGGRFAADAGRVTATDPNWAARLIEYRNGIVVERALCFRTHE
jgi:hypothetical protein